MKTFNFRKHKIVTLALIGLVGCAGLEGSKKRKAGDDQNHGDNKHSSKAQKITLGSSASVSSRSENDVKGIDRLPSPILQQILSYTPATDRLGFLVSCTHLSLQRVCRLWKSRSTATIAQAPSPVFVSIKYLLSWTVPTLEASSP